MSSALVDRFRVLWATLLAAEPACVEGPCPPARAVLYTEPGLWVVRLRRERYGALVFDHTVQRWLWSQAGAGDLENVIATIPEVAHDGTRTRFDNACEALRKVMS